MLPPFGNYGSHANLREGSSHGGGGGGGQRLGKGGQQAPGRPSKELGVYPEGRGKWRVLTRLRSGRGHGLFLAHDGLEAEGRRPGEKCRGAQGPAQRRCDGGQSGGGGPEARWSGPQEVTQRPHSSLSSQPVFPWASSASPSNESKGSAWQVGQGEETTALDCKTYRGIPQTHIQDRQRSNATFTNASHMQRRGWTEGPTESAK